MKNQRLSIPNILILAVMAFALAALASNTLAQSQSVASTTDSSSGLTLLVLTSSQFSSGGYSSHCASGDHSDICIKLSATKAFTASVVSGISGTGPSADIPSNSGYYLVVSRTKSDSASNTYAVRDTGGTYASIQYTVAASCGTSTCLTVSKPGSQESSQGTDLGLPSESGALSSCQGSTEVTTDFMTYADINKNDANPYCFYQDTSSKGGSVWKVKVLSVAGGTGGGILASSSALVKVWYGQYTITNGNRLLKGSLTPTTVTVNGPHSWLGIGGSDQESAGASGCLLTGIVSGGIGRIYSTINPGLSC